MNKILMVAAIVAVAGCAQISPKQQFVNGCATVGEAMATVVDLRAAGKVDTVTYDRVDDLYDSAVKTCDTLPLTDDASSIALTKINEFLVAASGVTGHAYPAY